MYSLSPPTKMLGFHLYGNFGLKSIMSLHFVRYSFQILRKVENIHKILLALAALSCLPKKFSVLSPIMTCRGIFWKWPALFLAIKYTFCKYQFNSPSLRHSSVWVVRSAAQTTLHNLVKLHFITYVKHWSVAEARYIDY